MFKLRKKYDSMGLVVICFLVEFQDISGQLDVHGRISETVVTQRGREKHCVSLHGWVKQAESLVLGKQRRLDQQGRQQPQPTNQVDKATRVR